MKDRYLYRAKRIDSGEWLEGNLITDERNPNICFIGYLFAMDESGNVHDTDIAKVDRSTICQWTGLKDKNGKLIWENDVISINTYSYEEPEDTVVGVVKYSEANTGFCLDDGDSWIPICEIYGSYLTEYFVVGNIFDNPELLEQEG